MQPGEIKPGIYWVDAIPASRLIKATNRVAISITPAPNKKAMK